MSDYGFERFERRGRQARLEELAVFLFASGGRLHLARIMMRHEVAG